MESDLPQKTSTPKTGKETTDETLEPSKESVDLTQSTSSSGDQTGTPKRMDIWKVYESLTANLYLLLDMEEYITRQNTETNST